MIDTKDLDSFISGYDEYLNRDEIDEDYEWKLADLRHDEKIIEGEKR